VRILLTGRNGQVGWELERALAHLGDLIATDRAKLDLADPDAIRRVTRESRPHVILNAAAYTAVDRAESEPELAMRVNGEAPGLLAEEAKRTGALLVHYSTDFVFDGQKRAPYAEDDPPNPLNVYGRTKLFGERAIQTSGCRHLILRVAWVYGPRGRNFFLTIARRAEAGDLLRVVDDQIGTPTTSAFLAEATTTILSRHSGREGVYHLAPTGATSWYGFARAIVERIGARVPVSPIRTTDYRTAALRPAYSVLDARRAEAELGLALPMWEALLDRCASQYLRQTRT
jgi:dTDP-4-dehydrorhamnose reductase